MLMPQVEATALTVSPRCPRSTRTRSADSRIAARVCCPAALGVGWCGRLAECKGTVLDPLRARDFRFPPPVARAVTHTLRPLREHSCGILGRPTKFVQRVQREELVSRHSGQLMKCCSCFRFASKTKPPSLGERSKTDSGHALRWVERQKCCQDPATKCCQAFRSACGSASCKSKKPPWEAECRRPARSAGAVGFGSAVKRFACPVARPLRRVRRVLRG
jgi:hypothetical protein